jgi:mono/diheme cytochrome c family protein
MMVKPLSISTILLSFLLFSSSVSAQDQAAVDAGKELFRVNCAACHNKDMKSKMTGPALGGVEALWDSKENLYKWIRNSQAMIAEGHPRAVQIWNEYKPVIMNPFPNLTDKNIDDILLYIDFVYKGLDKAAGVAAVPDECAPPVTATNKSKYTYIILLALLAVLAFILSKIISNLNRLAVIQETGEIPPKKSFTEILTNKSTVSLGIFGVVLIGGYFTVHNAVNLGRQQGYQPEQPIKFSHITHSCVNKIDCNYCHDGARRSKHGLIPAANTCLNCHKAIKVGSTYGTAELTKIYASIGFDPNNDKYIQNYDSLSQDDIKNIYTKWIADNYVKEKGSLGTDGEALVDEQWNGIVEALTNPDAGDFKIQGPIEWVRVHNSPDHVYFNHAQHVTVGKVECQTCHGKVENMAVVKQYAPLSMGWCVNCHRQTEVKFADNKYYDNYYELYHKQLAGKKRDKVTVEDIGGIECQKCHY